MSDAGPWQEDMWTRAETSWTEQSGTTTAESQVSLQGTTTGERGGDGNGMERLNVPRVGV